MIHKAAVALETPSVVGGALHDDPFRMVVAVVVSVVVVVRSGGSLLLTTHILPPLVLQLK